MDTDSDADSRQPAQIERLWTPWRMRYVGGGAGEEGCLFCNRLASGDDARSLILYRGERVFIIMNLFPYNTGHVMVVPNNHVASPEGADDETLESIGALLKPTLRALRRVLNADGFNVGINVGAVAGAGVVDHLHQHIVPRWQGDANFMPILAATMVLPELIPVTYAKLRAELGREFSGLAESLVEVTLVVLSDDSQNVLLHDAREYTSLPTATAESGEALWRAAARHVSNLVAEAVLGGWAGGVSVSTVEPPALTFLTSSEPRGAARFETIERAHTVLQRESDRRALTNAVSNIGTERTSPR